MPVITQSDENAMQTPASVNSATQALVGQPAFASTETLDSKAARRVLINNIKWLHARIETLDLDSSMGQQMFEFYSSKIKMHQHCLRQMNAQSFSQAA